jgi:hypothetical protein
VALYLLLTRRLSWRQALGVAGGFVGASVVLNAGILSFLALSLKGWNRLISQTLQGQYFIDFLTEQFLPFYLGLVSYPISSSVFAPYLRDQGAIVLYVITLVVIITMLAVVVRWMRQEPDKASVVLAVSAATIYFVVWYTYTFRRPYGYALFKMCSWLQFMYVMPLAYALDQASGWGLSRRGIRRWAARAVWPICVFVLAANAVSTVHLATLSLGHDTRRGMIVNLYDMSGNRDYLELAEQVGRRVGPLRSVGLSFVDSIQNEWASYYLRDLRTSLLSHYVIPADDENLPGLLSRWVTDYYGTGRLDFNYYFHGTTDDYYLTWSDRHLNRDIVERKLPPPIWENGTFQLQSAADNPGFIYTGRGFYRLEFRNSWDWWWPDRFRWTAEGAEIYMLRGKAGLPHRLSFYGIVGHGLKSERRTVELWMNSQKFDEVTITSAARVVSKPFYPTGRRGPLHPPHKGARAPAGPLVPPMEQIAPRRLPALEPPAGGGESAAAGRAGAGAGFPDLARRGAVHGQLLVRRASAQSVGGTVDGHRPQAPGVGAPHGPHDLRAGRRRSQVSIHGADRRERRAGHLRRRPPGRVLDGAAAGAGARGRTRGAAHVHGSGFRPRGRGPGKTSQSPSFQLRELGLQP